MSETTNDVLRTALAYLGRQREAREKIIRLCLEIEKTLPYPQGSIREEVTGPIVDALHTDDSILEKSLADGTRFRFLYRTKIARDFVMADSEHPDHVWEPQTTKLLLYLARNAQHALVGGAYSGDHVILMAKRMLANNGICHAFEPNRDQLSMLRQNADLNELGNIKSHAMGLWDHSNAHLILDGHDSYACVAETSLDDPAAFTTISIDDYVSQNALPRLDLIMLDIEGAELQALKGAREVLSQSPDKAPNVVFEVHRHYVDWSQGLGNTEIIRLMRDFGYYVFAVRDFNSNVNMASHPIELIPVEEIYLDGPPHGFNMLGVKDMSVINDLFRICHHVSPKLLWHKDPILHHPIH